MESIIWIQNSDEDKDDFMYENFSPMHQENMHQQQQYISEMLNSKKRAREILLEPYLKIYNKGDLYLIDLKSEDLDKYGRKGASMIFIKNYNPEVDEIVLRAQLAKIFSNTGTIVSEEFLNRIFSALIKKKSNNLINYYSIATIFVLLLIILFVLKK
ncbi:hypothetical protein [Chryseobacterium sp. RR2-3-20]|uniref:hypothetical protein n=1 Tax=Chryseobacterium sp. RR2-3-20 TaxID=2787626 RepID=UPI001AE0E46C|nr:hypothetical protein [Chryseobacterium sp. RR2-3-20]